MGLAWETSMGWAGLHGSGNVVGVWWVVPALVPLDMWCWGLEG